MKTCPLCKMRYPNDASTCFVEGSELVDLPDPRIGQLLAGRYVLEEVVGEGGMATVYRARHKLVDRPVAVKIMNPMFATDAVVRERFRREARSAQKLTHPNIIEIFDQGETEDGTAFIVMELLAGEPLANVIARGRMPIDRAVHVMIQIARGLARAHDLDIIHRDVKPENIFLTAREDGTDLVKLLDFGIAKSRTDSRLTNQGELFGTPQYMAPERIMGNDSGGASDLYALGVVFFEMLTGCLPFDAPDVATFFMKHMNEPPPSVRAFAPRVPEVLDHLVVKMLAKTPQERPASAHRVHQDLLEIVKERAMVAPPSTQDEGGAPVSVSPPTLAEGMTYAWTRRIDVLEQMLARAFDERAGQAAPPELRSLLAEASRLGREVAAQRSAGVDMQRRLEAIEERGRDKRARLGATVDQLGVEMSKAKEETRAAQDAQASAESGIKEAQVRFKEAQRALIVWEGRSGFVEPWPDLSAAYRDVADAVDAWRAQKDAEREAGKRVENAAQLSSDLDFQIRALRGALAAHEAELDEERVKCEAEIRAHGEATERLEQKLLDVTTRFTDPLRGRQELQTLFKLLEGQGSQSAA